MSLIYDLNLLLSFKEEEEIVYSGSCTDKMLDKVQLKLKNYGINTFKHNTQEYSLSIFYPKKDSGLRNQLIGILSLVHDSSKEYLPNVSYLMSRVADDSGSGAESMTISKTESSISNIIEKMSLFTLRKKYQINFKVYPAGDFNLKFGVISSLGDSSISRTIFGVETIMKCDFSFLEDIVISIFGTNLDQLLKSCVATKDQILDSSVNEHHEAFQLVEYILRK